MLHCRDLVMPWRAAVRGRWRDDGMLHCRDLVTLELVALRTTGTLVRSGMLHLRAPLGVGAGAMLHLVVFPVQVMCRAVLCCTWGACAGAAFFCPVRFSQHHVGTPHLCGVPCGYAPTLRRPAM